MKKKYNEYFNQAAEHVFILKILYFINIPLVIMFNHFNVKPHTITTLSNISTIISYFFLFYNTYLFAFFWIMALMLDICDGIVARMTKQSSAIGSFYDHYSDIVKILLLYLFVAVKYDAVQIWILAMLNVIVFSLMAIANMILKQRKAILQYEVSSIECKEELLVSEQKKGFVKRTINKYPLFKKAIFFSYSSIFVIYGNFNLLLIPLAVSEEWAFYTFMLVFIVVFKSMLGIVKVVHKKNVFMQENNIKWK